MRIDLHPPAFLGAALLAGSATSAFAVDYLNAEQAQKLLFPEADQVIQKTVQLGNNQLQALAKRAGIAARSAQWTVQIPSKAGKPLGILVMDNVVGKFELITYATALDLDGKVRQVEIMSYRESHGGEIRLPAWRKQFVGKSANTGLNAGADIANISGATLSCQHLTDGVRRISALVQMLAEQHALPL